MENYRPIHLKCIFKSSRKIGSSQIIKFSYKFFFYQMGFWSSTHPKIHFLNKILESLHIKKNLWHLKKAFNTCDYTILLLKLEKYGISKTEL